MKHFIITLAVYASSFFTAAHATDIHVADPILSSFRHSFSKAAETKWEQVGPLLKATFILDGYTISAFYNSQGELIAKTRNISSFELPEGLKGELKKELNGAWIADLFLVSNADGQTYYTVLENADTKMILRAVGTKKWTVQKKTEKI